jgi:transposase
MLSVLLNTPARAAPFRFRDKMRLWQPPRPILQKLAALSALRQRLIGVRRQLEQPLAEQQTFWKLSLHKQVSKTCQTALKGIRADLDSVETQIRALIDEDSRLKELFDWITSIPGIGNATATELLVATDEFKAVNDAKKLACHAGVAPFEYRSGSSVRGRTSVSQHRTGGPAGKRLKSLFHLAAMSAIQVKAGRPVPRDSGLLPT